MEDGIAANLEPVVGVRVVLMVLIFPGVQRFEAHPLSSIEKEPIVGAIEEATALQENDQN